MTKLIWVSSRYMAEPYVQCPCGNYVIMSGDRYIDLVAGHIDVCCNQCLEYLRFPVYDMGVDNARGINPMKRGER